MFKLWCERGISQCCTTFVTFRFSRQERPLLSGIHYSRILKKRLYGNLWSFIAKGTRNTANYNMKNKADCINAKRPECWY